MLRNCIYHVFRSFLAIHSLLVIVFLRSCRFFIAHRCWSASCSSMSTSTYLNNNISTNIPITIHASFSIASKHGYRMNSDTDIERVEKCLAKASLCIVEATIESVKITETLSFRRSVRLFSGLSLFTFVFFISC